MLGTQHYVKPGCGQLLKKVIFKNGHSIQYTNPKSDNTMFILHSEHTATAEKNRLS